MFHKFWKNKIRFKELRKLQEIPSITFQHDIGISKRQISESQIPVEENNQIQTLQIRSHNQDIRISLNRLKQHSSSVVKSFITLTSHVRAAKYILILVLVLLVTWTPWFSYVIIEFIKHSSDEQINIRDQNNTRIVKCVNNVFKAQPCTLPVPSQYLEEIKEMIKRIVHLDEANSMTIVLSVFLSSLNSLANPILYAHWYPDFRERYPKTCNPLRYNFTRSFRKFKCLVLPATSMPSTQFFFKRNLEYVSPLPTRSIPSSASSSVFS